MSLEAKVNGNPWSTLLRIQRGLGRLPGPPRQDPPWMVPAWLAFWAGVTVGLAAARWLPRVLGHGGAP